MIFQILDWTYSHEELEDNKTYIIRLFGRTLDDKTILVNVTDFYPFFYIEIPKEWSLIKLKVLKEALLSRLPDEFRNGFKDIEVVEKYKFYGFTNYTKFKFAKITCYDYNTLRRLTYIFQKIINVPLLSSKPMQFDMYESNIEPFLRFMHINELDAVGWAKVEEFKEMLNVSLCEINITAKYTDIIPIDDKTISKFVIASFDIECTSSDGSFPQADRDDDKIIQIGTTFQRFGEEECFHKHIIVLGTCSKIEDDITVESYNNEKDVLLAWMRLIKTMNPDIITGYYIFGFDYLYMMNRSKKLGIYERFSRLSRIVNEQSEFVEQKLSSSALGDNTLRYYKMTGRVQFDLMKVIQREYKLESYKLDFVSSWFIREVIKDIKHDGDITIITTGNTYGLRLNQYIGIYYNDGITDYKYMDGMKFKVIHLDKNTIIIDGLIDLDIMDKKHKVFWTQVKDDIHPNDIFRLQKGSADDRALIAKYCVQDCVLCNKLIIKLQIIPNNVGMANVCSVPLSYLFLRGQGVKIFSLVAKECRLHDHLISVIKKKEEDEDESYEGAIVFEPIKNVYYEPIPVLDYSSLYPRSMIEKNLSFETILLNNQYDNLPDYNYHDVEYTLNNGTVKKCRFAQKKDGSYGIIPKILLDLLDARTKTKKLMELETDPFKKKVYDGLQLAYKITANSLYGQTGASTSPIHLKDIAASTTAIGRERLKFSKYFIENIYGTMINKSLGTIDKYMAFCLVTFINVLDKKFNKWGSKLEFYTKFYEVMNTLLKGKKVEPKVIYGDTDSVFFTPHITDIETGELQTDKKALEISIQLGIWASNVICLLLPEPQEQAYEKTMYPFMILTKKRYVGNLYEKDPNKYYQKSMGIVLKRRDNAPIVKIVCAGIIDEILNKRNPKGAIEYTERVLCDILKNKYPIDKFVITKTLKSDYVNRTRIAHAVLADRMGIRDPGNKPLSNDRIPFVYIVTDTKSKLQGDHIEHVDYVMQNNLKIDYLFYITNQIMKPAIQFLELIAENPEVIFNSIIRRELNRRKGVRPIMSYMDIKKN